MARLRHLLFLVNRHKPGAEALAAELAGQARADGAEARISTAFPVDPDLLEGVDLCLVVGGDGTLLGVVEAASRGHVPVLGVNLGRLGFITGFTPESIRNAFPGILKGALCCRRLTVLGCRGPTRGPFHALNDVVIKARSSRLIRLEVYCEQEYMNTYHADGLILSTPTGSTAYSLSAGGPIVHPSARVLVVTPINPHTLSNRAIVLDDSHTLRVDHRGEHDEIQVSADGQEIFRDGVEFPIQAGILPDRFFPLVQPEGYSHYYVLRNKLRWTGDAVFSHPSGGSA